MRIRLAITTFVDGAYRPPGEVVELPDGEARSYIERFGAAPDDMTISPEDVASVDALNRMHAIHNG